MRLVRMVTPDADAAGLGLPGGIGLGNQTGYCVADLALHHPTASGQWQATAALVLEILAPGDETGEKLPFSGAHDGDAVPVVGPAARALAMAAPPAWLALREGERQPVERSGLIDLGLAEPAQQSSGRSSLEN